MESENLPEEIISCPCGTQSCSCQNVCEGTASADDCENVNDVVDKSTEEAEENRKDENTLPGRPIEPPSADIVVEDPHSADNLLSTHSLHLLKRKESTVEPMSFVSDSDTSDGYSTDNESCHVLASLLPRIKLVGRGKRTNAVWIEESTKRRKTQRK